MGFFYVTINSWRIQGPSCHRHGERQRRNALPKRVPRRRDGDDAHDDELRVRSRQGAHLYFVGPYPFNLTRRTRRRGRKPHLYKASESITASGSSNRPVNPTTPPDDGPPLSSGYREHRRVSN
jgi:hypothetical protein